MLFWILIIVMALAVAAGLGLALLRRPATQDQDAADYDMRVYRDQLAEIERDAARGVIPAEEAERIRNEVSRRLLAADAKRGKAGGVGNAPRWMMLAVVALTIGGAVALYWRIGAPGYGDLPLAGRIETARELRESRPDQATAEASMPSAADTDAPAEYKDLMARLREAVAQRPGDEQGLRLLARNEGALGNFKAAYAAQEKLLGVLGPQATAVDYADYADMLVLAAGGYVSPEAERAVRAALARDAKNGAAQYYLGLMMRQTGRPDLAFRIWDGLLRQSGPQDAWVPPIRAQIMEVAQLAGRDDYQPPLPAADLPGPSEDDIAAAGELDDEGRQAMIQGMVSGLAERLANQGGSAEEWARLIRAYGVLGDADRARAIRDEALGVFTTDPAGLKLIQQAGQDAGLDG